MIQYNNMSYLQKANLIKIHKDHPQGKYLSERQIAKQLGISKSEVHRYLKIINLPDNVKQAAFNFNIQKYVLLDWDSLEEGIIKSKMKFKILVGKIRTRAEFRNNLKQLQEKEHEDYIKKTIGPNYY